MKIRISCDICVGAANISSRSFYDDDFIVAHVLDMKTMCSQLIGRVFAVHSELVCSGLVV